MEIGVRYILNSRKTGAESENLARNANMGSASRLARPAVSLSSAPAFDPSGGTAALEISVSPAEIPDVASWKLEILDSAGQGREEILGFRLPTP